MALLRGTYPRGRAHLSCRIRYGRLLNKLAHVPARDKEVEVGARASVHTKRIQLVQASGNGSRSKGRLRRQGRVPSPPPLETLGNVIGGHIMLARFPPNTGIAMRPPLSSQLLERPGHFPCGLV
eukprot:scaffold68796_cov32-Tisochrysis_lutea.AAC.7